MIANATNGIRFLINEISIHWALEGCHSVVKLFQIFEDKDCVFLVLEYSANGSLMDAFEKDAKFTEADIRVIMEQLLLVLDFFQKRKIVHRDIIRNGKRERKRKS